MGDSDKLDPSGPERYAYAGHRDYRDALWEALDPGDRVVLVVHDWGSVLGFDWARRPRERFEGIAYMEAVTMPLDGADFTDQDRKDFVEAKSGPYIVDRAGRRRIKK